jgi:hypothetical protein
MHAEGLKGTTGGAVFELRPPPSASGSPGR